jgi:hypothetical protein
MSDDNDNGRPDWTLPCVIAMWGASQLARVCVFGVALGLIWASFQKVGPQSPPANPIMRAALVSEPFLFRQVFTRHSNMRLK